MDDVRAFPFCLCALAVWRIAHLITREDGPFDFVFHLRRIAGSGFWGKLLDCFYCASLWIAFPFACFLSAHITSRVVVWLALSGAASILLKLSERTPGE